MTPHIAYSVGTLMSWAGWAVVAWILSSLISAYTKGPGTSLSTVARRIAAGAVLAALLFIGAPPLLASVKQPGAESWRFPLIWLVCPFSGWLGAVSVLMGSISLFQGVLAANDTERLSRLKSAGLWFLALGMGIWLFKRDPQNHIRVLSGGIPLTPGIATAIVLLVGAAILAMGVAAREAKTRSLANSVAAHLTLATGSVVFGIPFVFLLITTFKESQDMTSPNGIVWIPHVSQTVPYLDKQDPQYEAEYEGKTVTCHIIGKEPNGKSQVEILTPMSQAGLAFDVLPSELKEVPKDVPVVTGTWKGTSFTGEVIKVTEDGHDRVLFTRPPNLANQIQTLGPAEVQPVRKVGLNWRNYPDSLEYLPAESNLGLVYLKNTLFLVVMSVMGTILSSAIVAYGFSRVQFPGRNALFALMLSTMMLPGAVTLLPTFLIFRQLHAIDTLYPLWAPAFFGSAFNIFMMRQFFLQIPMELEDAAKIDGCNHLATFWRIMLPQIKPVLTVVAIWGFMGAWNDFMGPLIYLNSPEKMPLSYALQLYQGDHGSVDPGLVMAFATMCMAPVLALFFFCQRYFIEGVTLSGLGGR